MNKLLNMASAVIVLTGASAIADARPAHRAGIRPPVARPLDVPTNEPWLILPAPAARGSAAEQAELAQIHALIAGASPARMEQARFDDEHEDPAIFDEATGRALRSLPRAWALLKAVQAETDREIGLAKNHFARIRPYGVDPTLHSCAAGPAKPPTRSYPSGHSGLAYSVGYVLARMMPERAPSVLARAADYVRGREYCGVHFPSDTEASHVLGTLVAVRFLADPRRKAQIEAARAELAGTR